MTTTRYRRRRPHSHVVSMTYPLPEGATLTITTDVTSNADCTWPARCTRPQADSPTGFCDTHLLQVFRLATAHNQAHPPRPPRADVASVYPSAIGVVEAEVRGDADALAVLHDDPEVDHKLLAVLLGKLAATAVLNHPAPLELLGVLRGIVDADVQRLRARDGQAGGQP